jgi:hypothetical protein
VIATKVHLVILEATTHEVLKRKQNEQNKQPRVANVTYIRAAAVHLIPFIYNYPPAPSKQISKQDTNASVK